MTTLTLWAVGLLLLPLLVLWHLSKSKPQRVREMRQRGRTCQHFAHGVDRHCHTVVGCNLRQPQFQQGQHLKKRCKLWAPTWQKEVGWAPEAG